MSLLIFSETKVGESQLSHSVALMQAGTSSISAVGMKLQIFISILPFVTLLLFSDSNQY
jgi:hypothetical protein